MNLTYGAELEIADCDTNCELPEGNSWDRLDWTVVNSDGQWNDPLKYFNTRGGEINTKVCHSIKEAVVNIIDVYNSLDVVTFNHSTNFHIHVGIENWTEEQAKQLVDYVWRYQRVMFAHTPLPKDLKYRRRKTSNQHRMPKYIRDRLMEDFTEVNFGNTRFGINLKSLFLRGTIEFRQFAMTKTIYELYNAFGLCSLFVKNALLGKPFRKQKSVYEFPLHKHQMVPDSFDTHVGKHSRLYVARHLAPIKIAFICLGNVNRSKVAESIFSSLDTENLFDISSYGVREGTYGKPMHKQSAKLLVDNGYAIPTKSSRKLPEDYKGIVIDVRDVIDPGYTKDLHYEAFLKIEVKMKLLYKEILGL